jgi:hypothetical protein
MEGIHYLVQYTEGVKIIDKAKEDNLKLVICKLGETLIDWS